MWDAIKAVTFDLDGVLVDSESINVDSAFRAFEECGLQLEPDDVASIVGRHPIDYLPLIGERFALDVEALHRIRQRQGRIYLELWKLTAAPAAGALEALELIDRAGFPIALATSGGRVHVNRCLDQFGIGKFFAFVLTKDDVERRKPHPEVYRTAAARFGIPPSSMLVVEDSEYGVRAAAAAGAPCVAVRNGHTVSDRLVGACTVLDGVGQLPALLGSAAMIDDAGNRRP